MDRYTNTVETVNFDFSGRTTKPIAGISLPPWYCIAEGNHLQYSALSKAIFIAAYCNFYVKNAITSEAIALRLINGRGQLYHHTVLGGLKFLMQQVS